MDPRLLEAAQKGDVSLLNDLIRSNALILEEAALQGDGNTPLHVACVAGHLNFVQELLKLIPKLVEKVNANGFSPLHIAAARGDVETVREILKAGRPQHLCLVKGREGRIPLHCATANGEVGAMGELLSASPESIEEKTAREETALHLAVKNNRFDALSVLVEHLKPHNKEQVINSKDKNGDTILHLAAAASNSEVVYFLLSGHALNRVFVEVNALNCSGSTPLDVLPCSDRESREILLRAGGQCHQSNLPSSQVEGQKSLDDARSDVLVVAGLIATTTFQAVIQPITLFKKLETHSKNKVVAGSLSFLTGPVSRNLALGIFLTFNTVGFFLSVLMICRFTKGLRLRLLLIYSTISMVITYLSCMVNVPSRSLRDEHFSPLGAMLISSLAILISFALALMADRHQKWLERTEQRIAREGLTASEMELLPLLKWIRIGVPQGNANRTPRPN